MQTGRRIYFKETQPMLKLPDVTLIAPTGANILETIQALEKCCEKIQFAEVKFISHILPDNLPAYIEFEESTYKMDSYIKYNEYVFRDLSKHVNTSHCLLIQYDGYIINPDLWNNAWLDFDYIGAPWPIKENSYIANNGERVRVGNGGFSLRSKKLLGLPLLLNLPLKQEQGYWNEDGNITCYWRKELLEQGIKYGAIEQAARFSYETPLPENNFGKLLTFGYHRNLP